MPGRRMFAIVIQFLIDMHFEFTCFVVLSDFSFQAFSIFAIPCNIVSDKKVLSLVLERVHEALSL